MEMPVGEIQVEVQDALNKEIRHTNARRNAKREASVVLVETGLKPCETAVVLGTTTEQVNRWIKQYDKDPESFSVKTRRVKMAMIDVAAQATMQLQGRLSEGNMQDVNLIGALRTLTKQAQELDAVQEEPPKPNWETVTLD